MLRGGLGRGWGKVRAGVLSGAKPRARERRDRVPRKGARGDAVEPEREVGPLHVGECLETEEDLWRIASLCPAMGGGVKVEGGAVLVIPWITRSLKRSVRVAGHAFIPSAIRRDQSDVRRAAVLAGSYVDWLHNNVELSATILISRRAPRSKKALERNPMRGDPAGVHHLIFDALQTVWYANDEQVTRIIIDERRNQPWQGMIAFFQSRGVSVSSADTDWRLSQSSATGSPIGSSSSTPSRSTS